MKRAICLMLAAGQLLAVAQPVAAADFADARDVQAGAFAGFRLRVPMGADPQRRGVQAGLAIAPMVRGTAPDGRSHSRFGEGIELGFGPGRPPALTLAGTRIDRLALAPNGSTPSGPRANISPVAWVAIGVGVLALGALALFEGCRSGDICGSDRDP